MILGAIQVRIWTRYWHAHLVNWWNVWSSPRIA